MKLGGFLAVQTSKVLPFLVLVTAIVLSVIVWFYPSNGNFRVDNPFWNGLSVLSAQEKVVPLNSLGDLPIYGKGTALLLVPYEQFSENELAQVRSYVSSGGTLVLLDDYGFGNQVLGGLGSNMRFTGQPLLGPLFNYHNEWLPKITSFTNSSLTTNVTNIVLNHATSLNQTSEATVIAVTSSFSFLDMNDNGVWDAGEPYGPFVVSAYFKLDQGYVVAITDPSLLINGMINLSDNLQFTNNVVSIQGSKPQVFVDQTHLPKTPLDGAKADLSAVYGLVASPLGTLTLIVVALALSLKPFWKRREKHEEKR
jgi:hypothetical protein